MINSNEDLALFLSRCDELLASQFILGEEKIRNLLKSVANCESIVECIKENLIDFEYEKEFENCLIEDRFSLPSEPKKIVALCFLILLKLDNNEIDFFEFMDTFSGNGSQMQGFNVFLKEIILPFKIAVKYLVSYNAEVKANLPKVEEELIEEKKIDSEKALKLLVDDRKAVMDSKKYKDKEKMEVIELLDDLSVAIKEEDKEKRKKIATAYQYVTAYFKKIKFNSAELLSILLD